MIVTTDVNNDVAYITDPMAIEWIETHNRLGEVKLHFANSQLKMKMKVFQADVLPFFKQEHRGYVTSN